MLLVKDIAKMIDHSLLQPNMTPSEVKAGCELAKEYDCATVCVKPSDVSLAKGILEGSDVKVSTVIGFPHGAHTTATKVFEAKDAIANGCVELDMVMNIGRLRDGDYEFVANDVKAVVDAAHSQNVIVKVILENCYLTEKQKKIACEICENAGADFVKTSTGYGTGGTTIEDLKLMRATCSNKVRVKAAGGIRSLDQALAARSAGAVRCGATATKAIMEDAKERQGNGTLKELSAAELGGTY